MISVSSSRIISRYSKNHLFPSVQPFYRRYPFNSKMSLRSADSRGCVDLELGFFYSRVPKAANSTVVSTLASLKTDSPLAAKEAKLLFTRPSDLTSSEVESFDDLYKFTVVRDPYIRTLSAFLDKVERKQESRRHKGIKRDFRGFLKWLDGGKLHSNAHWAPQSSLLLLPLEEFDFIGRVEGFPADLQSILGGINSKNKVPAKTDITSIFSNSTSAIDKLAKYYDAETCKLVARLYRQDFEMFGYSLENDWLEQY